MHPKKLKWFALAVAVGALATLFTSRIKATGDIDASMRDLLVYAFSPETKASEDVVMVWLDEATMRSLPYRSPVPRDFLAKLNDAIAKARPRLAAYDVFLRDPSFAEADRELALSLAHSSAYAVVPLRPKEACGEEPAFGNIDGCAEMPDEMFLRSLKGVGLAGLPFSAFDSRVRYFRTAFETDSGNMPSFAKLIYTSAFGRGFQAAKNKCFGPICFSPLFDEKGSMLIRFAGPPSKLGSSDNAFKVYSAKLVADGVIPSDWLSDKIVMVGAAYDDGTDAYLTPYYQRGTGFARMNGVEIHANILSSLITGEFYYALSHAQAFILCALLVIISAAAGLYLSPARSVVAAMGLVIAVFAAAVLCFHYLEIAMPLAIMLASVLLSSGSGVGVRAMTEGRQRRFIKGAFARYVPATVVERLSDDPSLLSVGGEERVVTSMFTDIASFTSISERLEPKKLVEFLNEYLGKMNEVLFKFGATLDKYEGDAIIAFFNAPLEVASHEVAAAKAAIEITNASRALTEKWMGVCGREIVTRIGLNTGRAVVGNMGSEGRFDYTAIGDAINLASRLEGANKFYGTTIIAGDSCAKNFDDSIKTRVLDRVRVKGKSEPVFIHEVCDSISDELLKRYREAAALFYSRKNSEAAKCANDLILKFSDDVPLQQLSLRITRAVTEPEWDLTTELKSK